MMSWAKGDSGYPKPYISNRKTEWASWGERSEKDFPKSTDSIGLAHRSSINPALCLDLPRTKQGLVWSVPLADTFAVP